jgi:hypothetical protein
MDEITKEELIIFPCLMFGLWWHESPIVHERHFISGYNDIRNGYIGQGKIDVNIKFDEATIDSTKHQLMSQVL